MRIDLPTQEFTIDVIADVTRIHPDLVVTATEPPVEPETKEDEENDG